MESKKIVWSVTASKQFKIIIDFIANDSPKNSEKVKKEILEKTERLIIYPESHSPDKFKSNNDGTYRAFEVYHYRIAYRVMEKEIRILRIRHTSRDPKKY